MGRNHHHLHLLKENAVFSFADDLICSWKDIMTDWLWPCLLIPLTPQAMPDSLRRLLSTTGFWKCQKTDSFFQSTLTYPLATWLLNHYPQPWLKCCIRWFQQKLSHVYPPSQGSPGMFWVSRSVCLTCFLWWWPNDPINSPWIKDPRNNCIRVHIWLIFQICKIIHTWEKLLNYGSAISQVQKLALAP